MNTINKLLSKVFSLTTENLKPGMLVLFGFFFSIVVVFLDGVFDHLFFNYTTIFNVFSFDIDSHEIFMHLMLIVTFTIFSLLVALLLSKIKKEKEKLEKSELKFKTIAEYSKDWIYWITEDKSFNFISTSCKNITGYSVSDFINNPEFLDKIIYHEDRDSFIKHEIDSLKGKNLDEIEFRIVTKDNKIKWIHHLCQSVYDEKGNYIGHRVSNRDITKLKETQHKLAETSSQLQKANKKLEEIIDQGMNEIQTFMTQCPYPRAIYDSKGNLVNFNPAWKEEFESLNIGENIYNHPLIKNGKLEKKIRKVFKTGESYKSHPVYSEEIDKMLTLDLYSIKNKKNKIEKVVCNIEDITEQTKHKELSRELETRRDVVGEIFDFLDADRKYISQELHDRIGQNLMLIKMNAELQKDAEVFDPMKSEEIINLTLQTSKEIKEIIYSLYPAEIENYGLIQSIQNMIHRISKLSKIKFNVEFFGDYKPLSKRYELSIFRISQEALNNITKHSQATEAKFEYYFRPKIVTGIISDNGIGFNTTVSENVKNKYGIKFMNERIESIGGQLELHSEINKGTSIYFEIPIN